MPGDRVVAVAVPVEPDRVEPHRRSGSLSASPGLGEHAAAAPPLPVDSLHHDVSRGSGSCALVHRHGALLPAPIGVGELR